MNNYTKYIATVQPKSDKIFYRYGTGQSFDEAVSDLSKSQIESYLSELGLDISSPITCYVYKCLAPADSEWGEDHTHWHQIASKEVVSAKTIAERDLVCSLVLSGRSESRFQLNIKETS